MGEGTWFKSDDKGKLQRIERFEDNEWIYLSLDDSICYRPPPNEFGTYTIPLRPALVNTAEDAGGKAEMEEIKAKLDQAKKHATNVYQDFEKGRNINKALDKNSNKVKGLLKQFGLGNDKKSERYGNEVLTDILKDEDIDIDKLDPEELESKLEDLVKKNSNKISKKLGEANVVDEY